ncbi:MAG TPA: hypothetical protein VFH27_17990 [Longimicrobiaceae bacterium]|nr:hypothetical protein [Longimicrobiaceae bacterium]
MTTTFAHRPLAASTSALLATLVLGGCSGAAGISAPTAPVRQTACAPSATVDLQAGQTRVLSAAEAACMQVTAHGGARYVLAAFDGRAVNSAQAGVESGPTGDLTYDIGDGSGGLASTALPNAMRASSGTDVAGPKMDATLHASASAPDALDPFDRTTPWREGETFPVRRVESNEVVSARVARVTGRMVLAVVDADAGDGKFTKDAIKALDYMAREGVPVLDRVFGERKPTTSDASGQILVLLTAWNPDNGTGATRTDSRADGSGIHSFVILNTNLRGGVRPGYEMYDYPAFRLKVIAHELTHAWQMRYAYETQSGADRRVSMGAAWAMEGSADLVSVDLLRRYLGIGLTSNWDWSRYLHGGGEAVIYALEPAATRGLLPRGYFDASSFLRDLQVRLVRAGVPADEALAQVAAGAVEGWFGVDGAGIRRRGLADRMRATLGAGWDPRDAVLLWTATQAADDLSPSRDLDNSVYSHAGDDAESYAWKAEYDDMRLGAAFGHHFTYPAASSFFVRVSDGGSGGTLAVRSSDPAARWMLARVK